MKTCFYTQAKSWTNESIEDSKSKNYFKSWMKTIPARCNYLLDAISKSCYQSF